MIRPRPEIQDLLRERADGARSISQYRTGHPADAVAVDFSKVGSPETYFGAARNQYLGTGRQFTAGLQTLGCPSTVQTNACTLPAVEFYRPVCRNTGMRASSTSTMRKTSISLPARAMPRPSGSCSTENRSADTCRSDVTERDRHDSGQTGCTPLVQGSDYGVHTLELDIPEPGLQAYTFTFG